MSSLPRIFQTPESFLECNPRLVSRLPSPPSHPRYLPRVKISSSLRRTKSDQIVHNSLRPRIEPVCLERRSPISQASCPVTVNTNISVDKTGGNLPRDWPARLYRAPVVVFSRSRENKRDYINDVTGLSIRGCVSTVVSRVVYKDDVPAHARLRSHHSLGNAGACHYRFASNGV